MTYNGWKNYETWAVGMFLDGNYTGEGTYREALDIAEEYGGDTDTYHLAKRLEEYIRAEVETGDASLASDLLGGALSEVDWDELAKHKAEEVRESASV